jgi:transposase
VIDPVVVARIRSLYFGEHWKVGTIARDLGLHALTVQGALSDRVGWPRLPRPTPVAPYLGFIQQTLQEHPRLRATRIHEMLRVRGYTGSVRPVRRQVAELRPRRKEAFLELRTFPGEQAQVDWAHFGKVAVPGGQRALSCFVMTLSFSRALYLEFFFDQTQENFLRGHVRAFACFAGVPRVVLYDNLKAAVLERFGSAVRFHPRLLELSAHYHCEPRACGVRRGNEKGRVERAIRYIRESFFAARTFGTLAGFNAQAWRWRDEISQERRWVQDPQRRVADVLAEEQAHLLPLPTHPFDTDRLVSLQAGKTIYVPFDGNRYSIPPDHVGRTLTLSVSDTEVRILAGVRELVCHRRSYERGESITAPGHREALLAEKRRAAGSVPSARLLAAAPEVEAFLEAAFARGESAQAQIAQLLKILDRFGDLEFRAAVVEALRRQTTRASSVAFIAMRRQRASKAPLPRAVDLTRRPDLADLHVNPHPAEVYDELSSHDHEE